MPRLNYGTLLENIVILESTRFGLEHLASEDALGFATSFAMPPMTQCWCKHSEDAGNPRFNHAFLMRLATHSSPPATLQAMWSLCLKNLPRLPIRPFHQTEGRFLFDSGGPNGALLASLLAVQSGRKIHLWINDNAERYRGIQSPVPDGEVDELTAAGALLGVEHAGSAARVVGWFPDTISRLAAWLDEWTGRTTKIRIGFLDPDNYAEGDTQVSSFDHRQWLRTLATDCLAVLSATFSGCQNRGQGNAKRNQRLVSFHSDEMALYPESLVFEHGNFQTGVKIRWPEHSSARVANFASKSRPHGDIGTRLSLHLRFTSMVRVPIERFISLVWGCLNTA
jgi:hypothetical protein